MNVTTFKCERIADGSESIRIKFLSFIQISSYIVISKEILKGLIILYILMKGNAPKWTRTIVKMSFLSPFLALKVNFKEDFILYPSEIHEDFIIFLLDGILEGMNELALTYYFITRVNQTGLDGLTLLSMGMNIGALLRSSFMIFLNIFNKLRKLKVIVLTKKEEEEGKGEEEGKQGGDNNKKRFEIEVPNRLHGMNGNV